ncbi:double-strand break repair helicase AddA [Jannaschia sp. LMIT008]|uniref:double-strand break repair helicase AddA n=1 Tax=Jannaschia maritima TaxID=3032585 RepID=UPI0028128990|nr:double-strand break repair helicase AddA [Jannaschia sp. LMIT008]
MNTDPFRNGRAGRAPLHDDATRAQIGAADPAGSVWLRANAGSGKTRVLTNRVAWLLLNGTPPDRILCLTFTKAAAGEMQNRLFGTLGAWALLPDDALRAELRRFGIPVGAISTDGLRTARTLFASAIETPGGLKIQTIHAFCTSLLHAFPLEAGVNPAFGLLDDVAGDRLLAQVMDDMATDARDAPAVRALAEVLDLGEPNEFLATIAKNRRAMADPAAEDALRHALDVHDRDWPGICEDALTADHLRLMADVMTHMPRDKGVKAQAMVLHMRGFDAASPVRRVETLLDHRALLFTQKGEFAAKPFTAGVLKALGLDGDDAGIAEMRARLADRADRRRGLALLAQAQAVHAFAPRFLDRLQHAKDAQGWLDYDDQILRARDLLQVRESAQWVLYKLDGGVDHILVDEAQDTSPVQWDVVQTLAREMGAGEGARGATARTLFVVGDRKQSIYSFQGADPDHYDAMRGTLGGLLGGGPPLTDHALRHSFRSAPSILSVVDAVFAEPSGAGADVEHVAHDPAKPGRVDLWPHAYDPPDDDPPEWHAPRARRSRDKGRTVLARRIADAVAAMIRNRTPIATRDGRRPVRAGDVLILFRSRGALFDDTIAACRARGLPMAGADRLRLTDDLAVKDLLALLRVADTPEDDLSLAAVLRSPLGGLSEAQLFDVAHGRAPRTLLRALRDHPDHGAVAAMVDDVLSQADFLRPYEMLQRILIRHDGRRRLLGRLGREAAEPVDGLLHQALAYETQAVPSLTGFLDWIDTADVEIKREAASGGIRIMTIHGAKGLESPVVILPDCGPHKPNERGIHLLRAGTDGPFLWRATKDARNAALQALEDDRRAREEAERDRLLYVALTRAESWLICASAGGEEPKPGKPGADEDPTAWRSRIRTALDRAGATDLDCGPLGTGLRLQDGDWSPVPDAAARDADRHALPPWLEDPAPAPPEPVALSSPSDLGGSKVMPGEAGTAEQAEGARLRGTLIHCLLEHLPGTAPADRADVARALCDRNGWSPPTEAELAEVGAVIDAHPDLYGPGSLAEAPFVLPPANGRPGLRGTMDRVVPGADDVLVVDYKSNRVVPGDVDDLPDGILRQMGAYGAAAAAIWPGRRIRCAVLWTATNALMEVPHDRVTAAWDAIDPAPGGA